MQVCILACVCVCACVCSFLVAALPKRLRGGNTACGCPCPSFSLIIFYHARFLFYSLSFSGAPLSPPFPPHLCLSALLFFAQSVAAARASHWGTRQNFPSTFLPVSPHLSCSSFFSPTSVLLSPPPYSYPHIYPHISQSCVPPSPLILVAALDQSETANALPVDTRFRQHALFQTEREWRWFAALAIYRKSHSNTVQRKNLSWTVHNYFPNSYFLASSHSIALHVPLTAF